MPMTPQQKMFAERSRITKQCHAKLSKAKGTGPMFKDKFVAQTKDAPVGSAERILYECVEAKLAK
jgi:hypothetical protein